MDLADVDLTTEVVRTRHLVLRPYRPEDADAVFRACQDADIQRWIGTIPVPYTEDDARSFVGTLAPDERARGTAMMCAVEFRGELIGSCGLHALTTGRLGPEIGYWVAPWARGRGHATEAAAGLAQWAFDHGAPRVHLYTDVANTASQSVARRAGFTQEGLARRCLQYRDGPYADGYLFGRLPGD
jgi:RimJ/RimL family protein N-acetyltransferase